MASQTEIINLALLKLGQSIGMPNMLDQSKHGTVMRAIWPHCVATTMTDRTWPWSMVSRSLAIDVEPAAPGWRFRYAYPADCLKAVALIGRDAISSGLRFSQMTSPASIVAMYGDGALAWETSHGEQQTTISSNTADGVLVFQVLVEDTARYPAQFVEALACRLAAEAAPGLIGDVGLNSQASMMERYRAALTAAGSQAMNEASPDTGYITPSLAARGA